MKWIKMLLLTLFAGCFLNTHLYADSFGVERQSATFVVD